MRHLLTGFEFSQDEYLDILDTAAAMKKDPKKYNQVLAGRSGAIMFEKPSLRTRTTFELAFYRLGGHGVYLDLKMANQATEKQLQTTHVTYAVGQIALLVVYLLRALQRNQLNTVQFL